MLCYSCKTKNHIYWSCVNICSFVLGTKCGTLVLPNQPDQPSYQSNAFWPGVIHTIPKGQLISKRLLEKIIWTKIATKKFDSFCPGGQIKKIKTLYYIKYPIIDIRKCLYFFDLTTRAEMVKFFRCYFGPNDFFQKAF